MADYTQSNESDCLRLASALAEWSKTFHLHSQPLYLNIALWAISHYNYSLSDEWREDQERHKRILMEARGWSSSEYDDRMRAELKVRQSISLSRAIHFDWEIEMDHSLSKRFPFAFSPSHLDLISGRHHNEWLLDHARDLSDIITGEYNIDPNSVNLWVDTVDDFGWDPRTDTWKEFESQIDNAFKDYKAFYKARTEKFMKERGYEIAKEKRNLIHFEWLVRYQIQGWSMRQVADHYDTAEKPVSEDTVSHALHETSELVLLPLRKGGRAGSETKGA